LKVALCTDWFYPKIGGVASHVCGLATELERRGHEVVIINKRGDGATDSNVFPQVTGSEGLRYVEPVMPFSTILVPPDPAEIRGLLKKESFDIVHAHHAFTPTPLLSIAAAENLGIPAVLTNHTISFASNAGYFWAPMSFILFPFRRYIGKADKVIAVSRAAANFIGHFVKREKIVIIPNGVDVHRFGPINYGVPIYNSVDTIGRGPIILYVGRLTHRKGVHILLKAMPTVLKVFPRAQLLIAGNGYMQGLIVLLTKRLKLENHVKLLGSIPEGELPNLYNASNVFVLPSLYGESFGIVLLEAMASGRPIVASRIGGIPEVIENNVTGILVESGSKESLADAILKILSDQNLAEVLANNARKIAEVKYSWSVIAEKIEGVYEELAEDSD